VGFFGGKIPRSSAARWRPIGKAAKFRSLYDIGESKPLPASDNDPDRAQKLTSSSMYRRLSTCNISSKSMHAFLSNLANRPADRQTDKQTRAKHAALSEVNNNYNSCRESENNRERRMIMDLNGSSRSCFRNDLLCVDRNGQHYTVCTHMTSHVMPTVFLSC